MTVRAEDVQVIVNAQLELKFSLPPGLGVMGLTHETFYKEPDQYTLALRVLGTTVEEAQEALSLLRAQLVGMLQE